MYLLKLDNACIPRKEIKFKYLNDYFISFWWIFLFQRERKKDKQKQKKRKENDLPGSIASQAKWDFFMFSVIIY